MPPEDRHSGVLGGNGSGANVKSGRIAAVPDGGTASVTFATPFASMPYISLTRKHASVSAVDTPIVTSFSETGFDITIEKGHGGTNHNWDVHWVATDAGDP